MPLRVWWVWLCAGLIAAMFAGRASALPVGQEDNTARLGGPVFQVPNFNAASGASGCALLCKTATNCDAWTYTRPQTNPVRAAACYFSTSAPPPQPNNSCCISGLKPETPSGGMLDGIDLFGNDFAFVQMVRPDPGLCRDACAANANCRAWTYVRPTVQGPWPRCYLKAPAPPQRNDPCCISGVKDRPLGPDMSDNNDYFGNDFAGFNLTNDDPAQCQAACESNARCRAWTFVKPSGPGAPAACFLKDPVPALISNRCCVSGMSSRERADRAKPRLTGYQIVTGQTVTVASQSFGRATAPCPGSKIAVGAGYAFGSNLSGHPAEFGIEVKEAALNGSSVSIGVKHGGVFLPAISITATAICIDRPAGLRFATSTSRTFAACTSGETLIGGGFFSAGDIIVGSNGPEPGAGNPSALLDGDRWRYDVNVTGVPTILQRVTAVCVRGVNAFGARIVPSGNFNPVGPRSIALDSAICPAGQSVLAGGVQTAGPGNAPVVSSSTPGPGGASWDVRIGNRAQAFDTVSATTRAICADVSP